MDYLAWGCAENILQAQRLFKLWKFYLKKEKKSGKSFMYFTGEGVYKCACVCVCELGHEDNAERH